MAVLDTFTVTSSGVGALGIDFVDAGVEPDEQIIYAFVEFQPRLPVGTVIWCPTLSPPRGIQLDKVKGRFAPEDGKLRTIVAEPVNEKQTIAITGDPDGGTFTLTYAGQTTTAIPYNAVAADIDAALEALSNIGVGDVFVSGAVVIERQTITITITGSGGTFTLSFDGQTTTDIPVGASNDTVSAALQNLSNIPGGAISVTGPDGGPYVVDFIGSMAGQNQAAISGTGTAANEQQRVTLGGVPTAGTFTLTYSGQTTAAIAYNASAATIVTRLEALSNIGSGDVAVSGNGPWTVTFQGALAATNVAQMTGNPASLTGGATTKTVTVATTVIGSAAPSVGVVTNATGSTGSPFTVSFHNVLEYTDVAQMTATPSLTGGTSPNVVITTAQPGNPDLGVKLVANTAVLDLDELIWDVVFTVPERDRKLNPFAIMAPTTAGQTIDLASVTRLPAKDPGTFE